MQTQNLHGTNLTGFIRERQLRPHIIPISHSALWAWVKSGKFPAPHSLSPGVTAWRASDVQAWIDAQ